MPLLLYVNFEAGPPGSSPYVLGATEYSAGSDEAILEFTFGGSISATGATVGNYGAQFGGFDSHLKIAVSSGDIFDKNAGRCGVWVKHGGTDDTGLFAADGSALSLETRSSGVVRLRWAGTIILNTGDWGESIPTDRTPRFVEVKWDRANNLRAIRISTDSAEGTWREDTGSWSEPADATHVRLSGAYGNVYSDNWLISDDPDENLWELRNLEDYADYGSGGGPDLKSASDSLTLTLTDANALLASLIQTDTLGLTVSEAAALVGSLTATDAGTLASTETPTLSVEASAAESLSVGSSEASTLTTAAEASDALALASTETPSAEVLALASDTLPLDVTDMAALTAEVAASDTLPLSLADVPVILVTLSPSDVLTLTVVETADVDQDAAPPEAKSASDTLSVGMAEAVSALSALVAAADTLGLTASEAASLAVEADTGDALSVTVSDAPVLVVLIDTSEAAFLALVEQATLDAGLVPIAASDTLSVSLSSLPVVAVVAVAQDALQTALAEGASLEALVAGADVAQVAVSEQGAVSATAAASDQLTVSAALEAALAWHLSASDVLSLALGETIQVDATDVPVFVVARAPRLRWLLPTHTLRSRLPAYGLRCGLSGDWTMTAKITEGRTEPIPLLVEVDGAPIDLTGLTLSLIARRRDGTYLDTTGQLAAHPDQSAEGGHRGEVYWSPADTTTIRVADGPLTLRVRVEHGDPIKRRHHAESDPLILSVLRA